MTRRLTRQQGRLLADIYWYTKVPSPGFVTERNRTLSSLPSLGSRSSAGADPSPRKPPGSVLGRRNDASPLIGVGGTYRKDELRSSVG